MAFNFSPFPILTTPRLELRAVEMEDAPEIFFHRSDERMNEFIDREPAKTLDDAQVWIEMIQTNIDKNESINWGITLKNEPKLIGTICLWNLDLEKKEGEIGYGLHLDFWGRGLMNEAVLEVIRFGFDEMKLEKIAAGVKNGNQKSIKLLERCGFELEGEDGDYLIFQLKNPSK